MRALIRAGLAASLEPKLVDELLASYDEAKRNYYLGGHRLNAVEGGRLCEAAFRLLQQRTAGKFDPLGTKLDSERTITQLANASKTHPASVRLYIPRALRVIYDIRNNRNTAHLGDGIDPNVQDATLVVGLLDWVMAEFVRLYHSVKPDEAQEMVDALVTRQAPAIQDFGGSLKVLKTGLAASDHASLLLYQRGDAGATLQQIREWSPPEMRTNMGRTLRSLVDHKRYVHDKGGTFIVTRSGQVYVEQQKLFEL